MKIRIIILALSLTSAFLWTCKRDNKDSQSTGTITDEVKTYFAYLQATSGITDTFVNPTIKSARIKSNNALIKNNVQSSTNPAGWPSFYSDPVSAIFSDNVTGEVITETTDNNNDAIMTFNFGSAGASVPGQNYTISGSASYMTYNPNNLQKPVYLSYSEIANCQFYYPSTGSCYNLIGNVNVSACHLLIDSVWHSSGTTPGDTAHWTYIDSLWTLRTINFTKFGACDSEIVYTDNDQFATNSSGVQIIAKGSSQYSGKKATYNTTIIQPLYLPSPYTVITQGQVSVTFTKNGNSGQFTIVYGPNNIATITENGNTYQINYVQLQQQIYSSLN